MVVRERGCLAGDLQAPGSSKANIKGADTRYVGLYSPRRTRPSLPGTVAKVTTNRKNMWGEGVTSKGTQTVKLPNIMQFIA